MLDKTINVVASKPPDTQGPYNALLYIFSAIMMNLHVFTYFQSRIVKGNTAALRLVKHRVSRHYSEHHAPVRQSSAPM